MDVLTAFEHQADACRQLGSPMYAELCGRLAGDVIAGGPTARVLSGHEDDPGPSALVLRLLGSLHRLVLDRRAGELATYYPSVGGRWEAEAGSRAAIAVMERVPEAVREWLDRPPQTNEVGRATALMGGLLQLPPDLRRPVRLAEIGSSAGLNLLADRFCYIEASGRTFGDPASPVRLEPAWQDAELEPWPDLRVVERLGSDVMPVDAGTTEGRLALTAYVWPDQTIRHERLRGALRLAQQSPPDIHRQGAADFLADLELVDGTTTVLWHSVMWQYLSGQEQGRATERIDELAARATEGSPFVHLTFEPTRRTPESDHEFLVVLRTWPGGQRRVLGRAPPHGVPVIWEPATRDL